MRTVARTPSGWSAGSATCIDSVSSRRALEVALVLEPGSAG